MRARFDFPRRLLGSLARARRALVRVVLAAALVACATAGRSGFSPEAPPHPPDEKVVFAPKPGHVWIEGFWTLSDGAWSWVEGHYAPALPGQVFRQGFWERRGNGYYWVPGAWLSERADHTWVRGHYRRERGELVWVPGRWGRLPDRYRWIEGYWKERPRQRLDPGVSQSETRPDADAGR